MPSLRNTQDLKKLVLTRCGELTDGTSPYDDTVVDYLNSEYKSLIAGESTFAPDLSDPWIWSYAERPIILTLEPAYETGTVSLTNNSWDGTFSAAPTASLEGWFLKLESRAEYFRIRQHSAGSTSFELDQPYTQDSGTLNFKAIKLEYDLVDDIVVINSYNNKLDFEESAGTELSVTLTNGVYTPSELATHVTTVVNAAGADTHTIAWDSITRKFTWSSNGAYLGLTFATGTNLGLAPSQQLGFDVVDYTASTSYTSTYVLNAIHRLVSPMTVHKGTWAGARHPEDTGKIYGVSFNTLQAEYPLTQLTEGIPTRYCEARWRDNGIVTVRFDTYPEGKTRVEIPYVPIPRDLQDNTVSIPILPESSRMALVHMAAYFILSDKYDDKAQSEFELAGRKLLALKNKYRSQHQLTNKNYGRLVARRDNVRAIRHNKECDN